MKKSVLVFIATQCLFAFVAWIAGYSFNQRHAGIAIWVMLSVVFGLLAAAVVRREP